MVGPAHNNHTISQHPNVGESALPLPPTSSAAGTATQRKWSLRCTPPNCQPIARFAERIIYNYAWYIVIWFMTFILLFGSAIQDLWVPKSADVAFDVLYTASLVILILDMIFHLFADPDYFVFTIFSCFQKSKRRETQPKLWTFGVGSFMFWCDLISMMALIYDISYINRREFETTVTHLELDDFGVPVSPIP